MIDDHKDYVRQVMVSRRYGEKTPKGRDRELWVIRHNTEFWQYANRIVVPCKGTMVMDGHSYRTLSDALDDYGLRRSDVTTHAGLTALHLLEMAGWGVKGRYFNFDFAGEDEIRYTVMKYPAPSPHLTRVMTRYLWKNLDHVPTAKRQELKPQIEALLRAVLRGNGPGVRKAWMVLLPLLPE